jgi:hypothetical protein
MSFWSDPVGSSKSATKSGPLTGKYYSSRVSAPGVSKGWVKTREAITGKGDAGQKEAERLRAEQKRMFSKLGVQEEAMYGVEQAGLKRMQDPSLGIESEAKMRMTEAQARDPNNPVSVAFRNFYDQQAGNEGRQGLADVGVMQSLGAQAFGGQMGSGAPLSTGQMQAMMAQNSNQAGQAFANVQQRMQALKDQGVAQGWLQTQNAYNRGVGALDRYGSLSQMETDIGTGHQQRLSALTSGQSAAYQQMLAQQAQAKAASQAAQMTGLANILMPMSGAAGYVGAQQLGNTPSTPVATGK